MPEEDNTKMVQPELNIGMFGHVDHGKTTLTEKLSGKWTDTHSEEIKRGITIRLGYADVLIRRCENCNSYSVKEECEKCGSKTIPVRKISIVDAPGHESLMATMLAGATIIDGAIFLIAANESCPQPQTREHLMALEILGVKNIVIVQNKIDLVTKEGALKNYEEIKNFLKGTEYENAPIIPISAHYGINIDVLLEAIQEAIPTPERELKKDPIMFVARSFDINKPGTKPSELQGGVLGGSVVQGILRVGDEIEIRPGRKIEKEGRVSWQPIITKIESIKTGGVDVKEAGPGGTIGVLTSLDPTITKSDRLMGSVVGHVGKLPPVWTSLNLETHLLERVVGTREELVVGPVKLGESLMLNVNSAATVGVVNELGKNKIHVNLKIPVCANEGARVTISRLIGTRYRLIGYGIIRGK